jgi:hypothetical protein
MSDKFEDVPNAARTPTASSRSLPLDTWAVIVALLLSGAIWIGVIKHVPW